MLMVAAYRRTNLTLRQIALLFGVSKSAADRIICGQYGHGSALDGLVESGDELPMAPSA
ncbi:hypothetical protein QF034_000042 [Streptomyces africanus]|uniref:Transposase Helix-turn-helix domain-containing protein n=1 Tax=Streptomyces africanus TaxID=231024 RepID=A0ABU0QEI6_9ACTN|nr:hypothetical protein [Streptomyces africanus]